MSNSKTQFVELLARHAIATLPDSISARKALLVAARQALPKNNSVRVEADAPLSDRDDLALWIVDGCRTPGTEQSRQRRYAADNDKRGLDFIFHGDFLLGEKIKATRLLETGPAKYPAEDGLRAA